MGVVAVLGAGKIGEALLAGLLAAGRTTDELVFTERHPERAAELTAQHGVAAVDVADAAARAEVLVVAVKPQDIAPVLAELAPVLRPGTLVVTLCAGLPIAAVRGRAAGRHARRAGHAQHPDAGRRGDERDVAGHATPPPSSSPSVEKMLAAVGRVVQVPEAQQDAVTALSGSGPAYFFFLVEAMIDAGILLGLPRAVVAELIVQSAYGAAPDAARVGRPPGAPARGRHLARRARRSPRSASWSGTACGPRCSTPSRPRATAPSSWVARRSRADPIGGRSLTPTRT